VQWVAVLLPSIHWHWPTYNIGNYAHSLQPVL
jgi:hypothetical protein